MRTVTREKTPRYLACFGLQVTCEKRKAFDAVTGSAGFFEGFCRAYLSLNNVRNAISSDGHSAPEHGTGHIIHQGS